MKPFVTFGIPLGISSTFWFVAGLCRLISEEIQKQFTKGEKTRNQFSPRDIAAIIPAHNEELAIANCVAALRRSLDGNQIYVVSDGSSDATAQKATGAGARVTQTAGIGKAKAIIHTLSHFQLYQKYKLIFIVDADTRIDRHFVKRALPLFNDPAIGVVYGSARITWPPHIFPRYKFYYVAYRERLNRLLQYFFAFGQTWKYTNTTYVIPGFATIWKSSILKRVKIDTPGLLIEDFNTAFQTHKQKICKVGYNPACIGWDQHPESLVDYWKQVRRWNIGFFQTVKHNGFWPSFFWISLALFTFEVFVNSIFTLCMPLIILYRLIPLLPFSLPFLTAYVNLYTRLGPFAYITLPHIVFYVLLYDYLLSVYIGLTHKKPQFLIYGLFFFFMHFVTSLILISSLIPGFFSKSVGRWISPKRSLSQMSVKV